MEPAVHQYLSEMKQKVRLAMDAVLASFGCREVPVPQPSIVRYANRTTLVEIWIDRPGEFGVSLGRCGPTPAEGSATMPLEVLMRLRQPALLDEISRANGRVERKLEVYALALRQCAADLLAGDFTIQPTAEQLAEAERRRTLDLLEQAGRDHTIAQAAQAFAREDYPTVIRLLEPLAPQLTPAQLAKLHLARQKAQ